MEYENPWADKIRIIHKNVKSVKPEPRKPREKKNNNKLDDRGFVEELLEHAFRKLDKKSEQKIRKTFGESYDGAVSEIQTLKEDILNSKFLPDKKTLIMIGYMCMLRDLV